MKQIPFASVVLPPQQLPEAAEKDRLLEEARQQLIRLVDLGNYEEALSALHRMEESIESSEFIHNPLITASCYQIGAWINVATAAYASAIDCVIKSLHYLATMEKKGDDAIAITAALLFDYAIACRKLNSASKAEHALKKSITLYLKLSKKCGSCYLVNMAHEACAVTTVIRPTLSRLDILDLLQNVFIANQASIPKEATEALSEFVATMNSEASAMFAVGRYRTAVRYYTKSLRICRLVAQRFDRQCVDIATNLAEALLQVPMRKETGEELLTALRKYAESENLEEVLTKIDNIQKKEDLMQFNLLTFIKNIYT